MTIGLQLIYEGRTEVVESHKDATFYIGDMRSPVAIMQYKDIPDYLDEEFWSAYEIWNNNRLSNGLYLSGLWGNPPQRVVDIITAFQGRYENMVRG